MDEQKESQEQQQEEKKEFYIPHNEAGDKRKLVYLFLATFAVVIFIFTIFLKGINFDTNIGEENTPYTQSNENGINSPIDQRLKMIQNDEDMPGVSGKDELETGEDIVNKYRELNAAGEKNKDFEKDFQQKEETQDEITLDVVHVQSTPKQTTTQTPPKISKVYVGQFSDMQSAVDMQNDIMASGLVNSPIIKDINGYYTIQVGVFSSYEAAKKLSNQLQSAGFYANIR